MDAARGGEATLRRQAAHGVGLQPCTAQPQHARLDIKVARAGRGEEFDEDGACAPGAAHTAESVASEKRDPPVAPEQEGRGTDKRGRSEESNRATNR